MFRKIAICSLILLLGVLAAVALRPSRQAQARDLAAVARYRVVSSDDTFVLYDSVSGVSWVLAPAEQHRGYAWLPTKRLNNEAEAEKWRLLNKAAKGTLK